VGVSKENQGQWFMSSLDEFYNRRPDKYTNLNPEEPPSASSATPRKLRSSTDDPTFFRTEYNGQNPEPAE
jgi:hypothetical protein